MPVQIGELVRVYNPVKRISFIATISILDNSTCDIIYGTNNEVEESLISLANVSSLESFEKDFDCCTSPESFKDWGNILFNKKDFNEAQKYYLKALHLIHDQDKIKIGSDIIVSSPNSLTDIKTGTVSDSISVDNKLYFEVIFDESEDEDKIPIDSLSWIPQTLKECELLRSIHLNLSRCCMKLSIYGWSIKWCSLAIVLTNYIKSHFGYDVTNLFEHDRLILSTLNKKLADAYFLRGRSFLLSNRPHFAKRDAETLYVLDANRSALLRNDIDLFLKKRKILNKKLAHQISEYVDSAMTQISSVKKQIQSDDDLLLQDSCTTNPSFSNSAKSCDSKPVSYAIISSKSAIDVQSNQSSNEKDKSNYQNDSKKTLLEESASQNTKNDSLVHKTHNNHVSSHKKSKKYDGGSSGKKYYDDFLYSVILPTLVVIVSSFIVMNLLLYSEMK